MGFGHFCGWVRVGISGLGELFVHEPVVGFLTIGLEDTLCFGFLNLFEEQTNSPECPHSFVGILVVNSVGETLDLATEFLEVGIFATLGWLGAGETQTRADQTHLARDCRFFGRLERRGLAQALVGDCLKQFLRFADLGGRHRILWIRFFWVPGVAPRQLNQKLSSTERQPQNESRPQLYYAENRLLFCPP